MKKCKFCNKEIENVIHVRWCELNPDLEKNKIIQSLKISVGASERTKQAWADGKYDGVVWPNNNYRHTEETKNVISEKALASNHRRLVRSIRKYTKKDGSVVMLDSSWEEMLAKRLDELCVDWIRPDPLKWVDTCGKVRNYFPDFYLPQYDLFLDPKNPAAMKQQEEKVSWLKQNVINLIFLENVEQIKNYTPS